MGKGAQLAFAIVVSLTSGIAAYASVRQLYRPVPMPDKIAAIERRLDAIEHHEDAQDTFNDAVVKEIGELRRLHGNLH